MPAPGSKRGWTPSTASVWEASWSSAVATTPPPVSPPRASIRLRSRWHSWGRGSACSSGSRCVRSSSASPTFATGICGSRRCAQPMRWACCKRRTPRTSLALWTSLAIAERARQRDRKHTPQGPEQGTQRRYHVVGREGLGDEPAARTCDTQGIEAGVEDDGDEHRAGGLPRDAAGEAQADGCGYSNDALASGHIPMQQAEAHTADERGHAAAS